MSMMDNLDGSGQQQQHPSPQDSPSASINSMESPKASAASPNFHSIQFMLGINSSNQQRQQSTSVLPILGGDYCGALASNYGHQQLSQYCCTQTASLSPPPLQSSTSVLHKMAAEATAAVLSPIGTLKRPSVLGGGDLGSLGKLYHTIIE